MNITSAQVQIALNAAIRSLNGANDAVSYADSAMRKAKEAQAEALSAVKALETLVQAAWLSEQPPKG